MAKIQEAYLSESITHLVLIKRLRDFDEVSIDNLAVGYAQLRRRILPPTTSIQRCLPYINHGLLEPVYKTDTQWTTVLWSRIQNQSCFGRRDPPEAD